MINATDVPSQCQELKEGMIGRKAHRPQIKITTAVYNSAVVAAQVCGPSLSDNWGF